MKRRFLFQFSHFVLLVLAIGFAPSAMAQTEQATLVPRYHFQHFGQEEGLSQGSVYCLLRDWRGFLWVGTEDGLNRFDGYGFKVFDNDPLDPESLSHGHIEALFQDSAHNLWVGTANGLNRIAADSGKIVRVSLDPKGNAPVDEHIKSLQQDQRGRLWVGTTSSLLRLDPASGQVDTITWPDRSSHYVKKMEPVGKWPSHFWVATSEGLYDLDTDSGRLEGVPQIEQGSDSSGKTPIHGMIEQPAGTLWLATQYGVVRYTYETEEMVRYRSQQGNPYALGYDQVLDVCSDSADASLLWFATVRGLYLFDRRTERFTGFRHDPSDRQSLADDLVFSLLRDEVGALWIGTFGYGFDLVRPEATQFNHKVIKYPQQALNKSNKIMSFLQEPDHTLWIGSLEGGLIRVAKDGHVETHVQEFDSPAIFALHLDQRGLWVGTQRGIVLMDPKTRAVRQKFAAEPNNPAGLSHNWVTCFQPDPANHDLLWVGTYEGLDSLSVSAGNFRRYLNRDDPNSIAANWIVDLAVVPGDAGKLWIGTFRGGLNVLDLATGKFKRYLNVYGDDRRGPAGDSVLCVSPDAQNRELLWLGTNGGLSRMDLKSETFKNYRLSDGLPNKMIYGILQDGAGDVWVSTNKGLSRFNPNREQFHNYTALDGLQESEFNAGAYYKSDEGRLYFGGVNGFNTFFGTHIQDNKKPPTPVLSELYIANKAVGLKDPDSPLTVPIELTSAFTLQPEQNMFSLRFVALHYANPLLNRFKYKLDGFDGNWLETDAQTRMATYTKIPPGTYTFHMTAANKDGYWSEQEAQVRIKILPPYYRTTLAYLVYLLIVLAIIGAFLRIQFKKLASERAAAESERKVSARLRYVDRLKDEFLANTSHELRTPLNGIIGLAESLVAGVTGPLNPATRDNLTMIVSSARRLNNLVNDILDFSKLKNKTLELHQDAVNIAELTDEVLALTRPLARQSNLTLLNLIPRDLPLVYADASRLEQILYNLVGNAIKFTDEGTVTVSAEHRDAFIHVSVADTGIGIPADRLDSIFESFEQVDGSSERAQGGTGLGLAITRKVVELHGGTITVASVPGKGSTFTFTLALADDAWQEPPLLAEEQEDEQHDEPWTLAPVPSPSFQVPASAPTPAAAPDLRDRSISLSEEAPVYTILVVDDEPVNRQVIANYLATSRCRLLEAQSGQEALDIVAREANVDLVLLDIMMPRMSGFEVCRILRRDRSLFDLPVLFLTAKAQVEDLEEGFRVGANDYMNKPINQGELLARVGTHLQLLDAHRHLERRVGERTRDLAEKNDEIVRTQKLLVMQEKLAFLGNFTAGMAHEIRNPLNIVKNLVSVNEELAREILEVIGAATEPLDPNRVLDETEDLVNNAVVMKNHCERIDSIISQLLVFTREQKNEFRDEDLNKFTESYLRLAYQGSARGNQATTLTLDFEGDARLGPVRIMPGELSRAIINVVTNAIDSIEERQARKEEGYAGRIQCSTLLDGNKVGLFFRDNGCGIAAQDLALACEPFFTTRLRERHIGLGLAIAKDIIEKGHEGELVIHSEAGAYTEVILWLPLRQTPKSEG